MHFSTVHLIAGCRCDPPILFHEAGGEAISPKTGIASGKNQERPRKDISLFSLKITRICTVEKNTLSALNKKSHPA